MYEKHFYASWADMDFNSHMRNTAYMDKSADLRMMYFADNGFSMEEFKRQRLGPVVRKDEMEYFREINLLENMLVRLLIAGLADDGSHFRLRNEFFNEAGVKSAIVTSTGGWLDLGIRKLVKPPEPLLAALRDLPKTDDFEVLGSSIKN